MRRPAIESGGQCRRAKVSRGLGCIPDRCLRATRSVAERGSGPAGASQRWHDEQAAIKICGKRQCGANVGRFEIGEIRQHLGLGHARRQITEDVVHGKAQSPDTGLSRTLVRLDGDAISVVQSSARLRGWKECVVVRRHGVRADATLADTLLSVSGSISPGWVTNQPSTDNRAKRSGSRSGTSAPR